MELLGFAVNFARGQLDESGLELHAQAEAEVLKLVLDFVERLLAEVAVLEHLRLGLHGELADGGDVRVVEAVGRAHGKLDLVDAHVEELLELAVFLADLGLAFLELNRLLVEVGEEIEVKVGRGFATADFNKKAEQSIGVIPIDSLFSPVRKVKYAVENTRVGQRTDYDKLILEMWTDGRLTPDEALLQGSAILRHHLDLFVDFDKETIEFEESQPQVSQENSKLKKLLNMSVNEIELSVRAANCLNNANITTVGQLAMKTEAEMLKYRNFGKKSLNEIKDKLQNLGLSLGMKLEPGLVELPVTDGKVE